MKRNPFKDLEDVRHAAMGSAPVPQPAGTQVADLYDGRKNTSLHMTEHTLLHMIALLWDALQKADRPGREHICADCQGDGCNACGGKGRVPA